MKRIMYEENGINFLSGIAVEMERLAQQVATSDVPYDKQIEVISRIKRECETFIHRNIRKM